MKRKIFKYVENEAAYNSVSVSCDNKNQTMKYPTGSTILGDPMVHWKDIYFKGHTSHIWTHGNNFSFTNRNIREEINGLLYRANSLESGISAQVAGDILVANNETEEKMFCSIGQLMQLNVNEWTPIGAVIIPASHNVYGDYSSLVVSMTPMSTSTPAIGGKVEESMKCCPIADVPLKEYNDVALVGTGNSTGDENSTIVGTYVHANLPSDTFSGKVCMHDTKINYGATTGYIAPSPFFTDGSRNPNYYKITPPSTEYNALSDFGGRSNCSLLLSLRGLRDYSTWKPDANTESDYPAVSCCDMFYTVGTKQGDWYLPSVGEYGYIMAYLKQLNANIEAIQEKFGVGVKFGLNNYYLTSTKRNSQYMRTIRTDVGYVGYHDTGKPTYVRAVLRVPPTPHSTLPENNGDSGDVLLVNNTTLERSFVHYTKLSELETPSNYTPIGICVIPASHNVYGNYKCACISIKAMDTNSPSTGSGGTMVYWGQHGVDTGVTNRTTVVTTNNAVPETLTSSTSGYYATNKISSGTTCTANTSLKYNGSPYIPSPFLEDGSRNPAYYNTLITATNWNGKFDGKENTEYLCKLHTIDDLSTATKITNSSASNAAPAAAVCSLFCPIGTTKGEWYLPCMAEYGYVLANYQNIVNATNAIHSVFGTSYASAIASSGGYWTTTELDENTAAEIDFTNCKLTPLSKNTSSMWARAFIQTW